MAKALPSPSDGDILDVEFEDLSELQSDIDDSIKSITSEVDADENDVVFLIKVYRVEIRTGKSVWLFNCQPEELPIMERLRDSYGSGTYQIRVYKNKKLFRRFAYPIEAPKIIDKPKDNNDIAALVKAMMDMQQQNLNQMRELVMSRPVEPAAKSPDMIGMMTAIIGTLVQFKQLIGPANPQPGMSPDKMFEMFTKGIEVARDLGGGNGGGETGMFDIVRDLLKSPMLGEVIKAASTPQLPPVQGRIAPPNQPTVQGKITPPIIQPAASPQIQNSPAQPNGENPVLFNAVVKNYVNQLVDRAKRDSDPHIYALFILDNIPDAYAEEAAGYFQSPDLIEKLIALNPEVSNYREWFNELQNSIKEIINEPEEENLTGDAGGSDTGGHADEPAPDNTGTDS